ncbi:endonuclease NucS [Vulcanisaeta souniana]|uniref:Endonuclease NucS n=1 Tax=Vulcanisaeta souniana JCM 11219 TaxID=1293586 RepID=A0A830E8Y2_9CREN|nr:endonuclease NucS [Vulcanisaeta souniana]BDR91158.1 endonuclease NucS [Vulcanisaeta souniana JCM 11219]GGI81292.1 endonuclease NucS [Vulcanisaeta souniana JCM 11219]
MDITGFINNGEQTPDLDTLVDPAPAEALRLINLRKSTHVLLIYGDMVASYEGRAKSQLEDLMPRLVISKPDGTFMVHESNKEKPRLWNPPPSNLYASVNLGVLTLRSVRVSPREVVVVDIPVIRFVGAVRLGVTSNYRVFGTEEDLVNAITNNPSIVEDGLQVIAREYHTIVGDIDILGRDPRGNLVVIECKRSQAGPEAVNQLKRYVEHLSQKEGKNVRGILVAPSISSAAYHYLRHYGLEFRRVEPKSLA